MSNGSARFLKKLILFALLLGAVDRFLLASSPVVRWLYTYRPGYTGTPLATFVQKQVLRLEYFSRQDEPQVLLVGSSGVVNGVDVALIRKVSPPSGPHLELVNVGVTGLLASELPLLKRYFLRSGVRGVVYFYNSFSFPDELHQDGLRTRWDTREFFSYAPVRYWRKYWKDIPGAILNELFFYCRFDEVIRGTLKRAVNGQLSELENDYDYSPGEPVPGVRGRVLPAPASRDNWERRIYVDSDTDQPTLGYLGLRRFLELANKAGISVLVMPMPEPKFADYTPFRQGIDVARIDRRVETIAREYGVPYLPRSRNADLEENDTLFRDYVHFHRIGREIFSRRLAKVIPWFLSQARVDGQSR